MTQAMPSLVDLSAEQSPEINEIRDQLSRARAAMQRPRAFRLLSPRMLYSKVLEMRAKANQSAMQVEARTFWNVPMTVAFPDQVSMMIYRYGLFEEDVAAIFLARIRPGMIVFDVGAHFGFFSLLAAKLAGPTGHVHSFEPTPSTFSLLQQNLSNYPNVHAQNAAAFSRESMISFRDFGVAFPAFNSVYSGRMDAAARERAQATTYEVKAVSLDGFAQQNNLHPGFIKMDAEGAELDILQGMPEILRRDRPDLVLEIGDKGHAAGAASRQIISHLRDAGYRAFEYSNGRFNEHKALEQFAHANLLFIANEKCNDLP
jgi:FkbM family methyltransferase